MNSVLDDLNTMGDRLVIVPENAVYSYDMHGRDPVEIEKYRDEVRREILEELHDEAVENIHHLKGLVGVTDEAKRAVTAPFEFVVSYLKARRNHV